MALPVDYQTCHVTGRWVDLLGNPSTGKITFTVRANRIVSAATQTVVVPATIQVPLNLNGEISVDIPATDDPDISPLGFTYQVVEQLTGGGGSSYSINAPVGTTLDLSTVVTVVAGTGASITRGPAGGPPIVDGTIATAGSLPASAEIGHVLIANDTGNGWQWNGAAWVDIGPFRGVGVVAGGTTGQALVKTSSANYATTWADVAGALADGAVTAAKLNSSIVEPAAGVAGTRKLGTSSVAAAAGNDARLSDARTPTDASVTAVKLAAALVEPAAGVAGTRTLGTGATQAAAGNDARLSDARTPTAASVVPASFGATAIDAAAGTASARTLGTGATQAAPGTVLDAVPTLAAGSGLSLATAAGVSTVSVPTSGITKAMQENVATSTIRGRKTAGTGAPEDMTAADVRGILATEGTALAIKTADTSRASTTTVTDDPDLVVTLLGALWYVEVVVFFSGDPAADIKFQIGMTGSGSGNLAMAGPAQGNSTQEGSGRWNKVGGNASFPLGINATSTAGSFNGYVYTNGTTTTVSFKWSQFTSNATASVVEAGSYIRATKVF